MHVLRITVKKVYTFNRLDVLEYNCEMFPKPNNCLILSSYV